jgi:2-keto-3-deoxy-L-rhamnonate aldolase RhmA
VLTLIAAMTDLRTRKGMTTALFDIGLRQPNLVASSIFDFLVNDTKHSQAHRVQLLQSLEKVVRCARLRNAPTFD